MDPLDKRYRKRKGEGHVRRQEILESARHLFLSEGYGQTTIRRIAARAGVTSTALYLYFPNKDAILLEICDQTFAKLIERIDAIRGQGGGAMVMLRRFMEAYVRFGLEHPDEYRLTFMGNTREGMPYGHRGEAVDPDAPGAQGPRSFAMLQEHVEAVIAEGLFRPMDAGTAAELIWSAGHGFVSLLITFPQFAWSDREELIRGIVDLPLAGLLARPSC